MITTVEQAVTHYYEIKRQHHRAPRATRPERDQQQMQAFLCWCTEHQIQDPLGYMTERMEMVWRGSRKRSLPRIEQLPHDRLAKRWASFVVDQRVAEQATAERMRRYDPDALHIKSLAAPPLRARENIKRLHVMNGRFEQCLTLWRHHGGYHPDSDVCRSCPCAVRCAAQLNQEYGFDVVALRSGQLHALPPAVASALMR